MIPLFPHSISYFNRFGESKEEVITASYIFKPGRSDVTCESCEGCER